MSEGSLNTVAGKVKSWNITGLSVVAYFARLKRAIETATYKMRYEKIFLDLGKENKKFPRRLYDYQISFSDVSDLQR